jgi:hypothetical protein
MRGALCSAFRVIPKIVHQTARTKWLSPEEDRLGRRAKRLLPDWEMRLWDDRDNLDLLERHLPQFSARFKNIQRGIVKADIARCLSERIHDAPRFKLIVSSTSSRLPAHPRVEATSPGA